MTRAGMLPFPDDDQLLAAADTLTEDEVKTVLTALKQEVEQGVFTGVFAYDGPVLTPTLQPEIELPIGVTHSSAPMAMIEWAHGAIKPYHTKGKDDYGTPWDLFTRLHTEFQFDLDVCADHETAKCPAWIGQEIDALSIDWWGRVFMNPPFTQTAEFIDKMILELVTGRIELGVALVADRPDTNWMRQAASHAGEIRHLKGRVSYEIYPTPWQRACCQNLQGVEIGNENWPMLVKELKLPKTAIQALIKQPSTPGGAAGLSTSAPFPSCVLVFDKRKVQTHQYWDWRADTTAVYCHSEDGVALQQKLHTVAPAEDAISLIVAGWSRSTAYTVKGPEAQAFLDKLKASDLPEEIDPEHFVEVLSAHAKGMGLDPEAVLKNAAYNVDIAQMVADVKAKLETGFHVGLGTYFPPSLFNVGVSTDGDTGTDGGSDQAAGQG